MTVFLVVQTNNVAPIFVSWVLNLLKTILLLTLLPSLFVRHGDLRVECVYRQYLELRNRLIRKPDVFN